MVRVGVIAVLSCICGHDIALWVLDVASVCWCSCWYADVCAVQIHHLRTVSTLPIFFEQYFLVLYSDSELSTTKPVTPIEPNRPMLPNYSLESFASLSYLFSNFWKCATVGSCHDEPLLVFLLTNGCNEPPLYANKSLTISSYIFFIVSI